VVPRTAGGRYESISPIARSFGRFPPRRDRVHFHVAELCRDFSARSDLDCRHSPLAPMASGRWRRIRSQSHQSGQYDLTAMSADNMPGPEPRVKNQSKRSVERIRSVRPFYKTCHQHVAFRRITGSSYLFRRAHGHSCDRYADRDHPRGGNSTRNADTKQPRSSTVFSSSTEFCNGNRPALVDKKHADRLPRAGGQRWIWKPDSRRSVHNRVRPPPRGLARSLESIIHATPIGNRGVSSGSRTLDILARSESQLDRPPDLIQAGVWVTRDSKRAK